MTTEKDKARVSDNELIARFMGDRDNILCDPKWMKGDDLVYLRYHLSWDWLMPVVEKIISLDDEKGYTLSGNQSGYICIIKGNHTTPAGWDLIVGSGESKEQIEAVYQAVVQFIKWHNEQR